MAFPNITILIVTFNRLDILRMTVDSLMANLEYPKEKLHWLIADAYSPLGYIDEIKKWDCWKDTDLEFSVTEGRAGWGTNVNLGLSKVQTNIVFQIEDDYLLTQKLDLKEGSSLLIAENEIGYIRYRGHAGNDRMILTLCEADIANIYPNYIKAKGLPGRLSYFLLHSESGTVYVYTHGAHLKTKEFHRFYGSYPEHLHLGLTEEAFAGQVKRKMDEEGAPKLTMLPDWVNQRFDHIGISRQDTEDDIVNV